jgi:hypothetical protein
MVVLGSVLTKSLPGHSPKPLPWAGPLEDDPALEKGRCPAAFFSLQTADARVIADLSV